MSVLLKTKFQPANDAASVGAAVRAARTSPRVVPLITLRQPKKKAGRWVIPCAIAFFLAGIAAVLWCAGNVLDVLRPPALEPGMVRPDPEDVPAYAETIIPPLANVVAPAPIAPALPEKAAPMPMAVPNDPMSGITIPASSLRAPYHMAPEAAKPDPVVTVVEEKIKDTPAAGAITPKDDPASIALQDNPSAASLLDKAEAKLESGDDKAALAIYNRILAGNPADREALTGKANTLENTGQYEAAATAYRRVLALNPKDETARINLVSALGAWGAPAAVSELQRMVAMRPDFAPAQAALAEALVKQDKTLAALPHAWRASQIEPDNILYRLNLAIAYDRLGHSREAVGFYRDVLKVYAAADNQAPELPVFLPEIRQRVDYLEGLMESVETVAAKGE